MSCEKMLEKDEDCLLHMLIEQFKIEYKCYIIDNKIQNGGGGVVGGVSAFVGSIQRSNSDIGVCNILKKDNVPVSKDKIIDEIIELQDKYTDLCHFQTALIENNVSCSTTSNSKNILSTVALVIEEICSEIQSKNKQFTELPKE